eukprot:gene9402-12569_t
MGLSFWRLGFAERTLTGYRATPQGLELGGMKEETYRRPVAGQDHPANLSPAYKSTVSRSPSRPAIVLPHSLSEITGPLLREERLDSVENDLTRRRMGEPLGERIIVQGRVLDEDGKPVRNSLLEVWQCNAAGRYRHKRDQHNAPLDPNFNGWGKMMTDDDGRYRFVTIKPGPGAREFRLSQRLVGIGFHAQ